mmetsp:Transcript_7884/g.25890  ORF Transcript_7884/g.25890 Transcript_7884/m.25890 type:complete len:259 (-) Transcript_7884:22-798(-)
MSELGEDLEEEEDVEDDADAEEGDEGVEGGHVPLADAGPGPGANVVEAFDDEAEVVVVDGARGAEGSGLVVPSPLWFGGAVPAEDAGVAAGGAAEGCQKGDDGGDPGDDDDPVGSREEGDGDGRRDAQDERIGHQNREGPEGTDDARELRGLFFPTPRRRRSLGVVGVGGLPPRRCVVVAPPQHGHVTEAPRTKEIADDPRHPPAERRRVLADVGVLRRVPVARHRAPDGELAGEPLFLRLRSRRRRTLLLLLLLLGR